VCRRREKAVGGGRVLRSRRAVEETSGGGLGEQRVLRILHGLLI